MLYFLNWELNSPTDNFDLTQGNEVIEIFIYDIGGCRPPGRYILPVVQPGRSFVRLPVNIIYQKDRCSRPLKDISVQVRIIRGVERKLIYASNFSLSASEYIDGKLRHIPIYRIWYWEDFLRVWLAMSLNPLAKNLRRYSRNIF